MAESDIKHCLHGKPCIGEAHDGNVFKGLNKYNIYNENKTNIYK